MAERNPKYDVLRGLAILFVLIIHITADYAYIGRASNAYTVINVLNKLFTTAVPTFVALTVFLGLKSGKKRSVVYVLKKAVPIVVLYLLWSTVYIWYSIKFGGMVMPERGVLLSKYLLQGQACYHLYYIVMLLQLYIVIALLSHAPVKKLRPNPWLPLMAVAVQIAVMGLFIKFIVYRFLFNNTAVLVFFYLTSVSYGICLASDSERTEAFFKRFWWIYAAIMFLTALIRAWLYISTAIFGKNLMLRNLSENAAWELFIFGGIPVMFLLAEILKNYSPLALLGRHSLGIYFAHPLLLSSLERSFNFNVSEGQILFGMAVKFIAALALSYVFSLAMEELRRLTFIVKEKIGKKV